MTAQASGDSAACVLTTLKHTATYTNASAFDGWQLDYTQMSSGRYECASRELRLPGLQMFIESGNATVHQCGLGRRNAFVFGVPLDMVVEGRFNGRPWLQAINVFRGDRGLEAVVPPMSLLVVAIDREMLADYAWSVERVSTQDWLAKNWLYEEDRSLCEQVARKLSTIFDACCTNATAFAHHQSRRGAEQAVMEAVAPLILNNLHLPPPSYGEFSRGQIVRRARDFALAHIDEPLQIIDVCRALGVSRRALQYSFQEVLDVNPVAYLRLLRLNGARRDLLMAADESAQVKDVAARWGFWHLSRFSVDYREMFHERPSETLAGGRRAGAGEQPAPGGLVMAAA